MGIPLVALMGRTPYQQGEEAPVELQEKANAIRASQQQQQQSAALFPGKVQQQGIQTQLGQQAVQSGALDLAQRQAVNDAWKAAATTAPDGTIQLDPNKLQTALATSGHGEAIPAISKGLMDMQKSANELSTQKSTLAAAEADAAGAGAQAVIASGKQNPDGSITYDPNVKAAFFQHMANAGYGQQAQQLQQHLQQAPQTETQLWQSLIAASPKQQQLAIDATTANAKKTQSETEAKEFTAKLPGGPLNTVTQDIQKETDPRVIAAHAQQAADTAIATEKARQSMYPAALAGVQPQLIQPATADATKADQAFTQAQQAGNEMADMVKLAKSGNKVAYAYSPVTGVLQINVAGQIKRMNMPEIESYGAAGSALDKVKGFLGKQATGASIPDGVLNDMATVSGMVTKGARTKYEQDIAGINSRYGAKFQPMAQQSSPAASGHQVGDIVNVKGKSVKITKIYPDNSFDGSPQ